MLFAQAKAETFKGLCSMCWERRFVFHSNEKKSRMLNSFWFWVFEAQCCHMFLDLCAYIFSWSITVWNDMYFNAWYSWYQILLLIIRHRIPVLQMSAPRNQTLKMEAMKGTTTSTLVLSTVPHSHLLLQDCCEGPVYCPSNVVAGGKHYCEHASKNKGKPA